LLDLVHRAQPLRQGQTQAMEQHFLGLVWRGLSMAVVEELGAWKDSSREGARAGGELYLRRHYFRLRMSDAAIWTVYCTRQTPRSGDPKRRWFLYTLETTDPPNRKSEPQAPASYRYPDVHDRCTAEYIRLTAPEPGYWTRSEQRVLGDATRALEKALGRPPFGRLLDVGCGKGRLLPYFGRLFGSIVALDPDAGRLEVARRVACEHGLVDRVSLYHGTIQGLGESVGRFDAVLISHVIQHVGDDVARGLLHDARQRLGSRSMLVLLTSHIDGPTDRFLRSTLQDDKLSVVVIDASEFEALCTSPGSALPSRFFTHSSLVQLMVAAGFRITEERVFHVIGSFRPFDLLFDRDRLVNRFPSLRRGRQMDLMICARAAR
jgi:2-polyprenyl-3-methyl-5-hydroxy-6-metoxy-1,4-benzoquinol methylase